MVKKVFVLTILALIISTTLVKNYTKKLDDKIFSVKENINYLTSSKELVQLEYDYLSSPEKLLELNSLYFDDELKYTPRSNIIIITDINEINLNALSKNGQSE